MTKTKYRFALTGMIFSLLVAFSANAFAQAKTYNEEITVVAPFDPIIPDAFKISHNPAINDSISSVPVMSYSIAPRVADVKPVIEQLPAVKLVAEPLTKLYRNYARAGVGNYTSLYGELFISSLRSKQYLASLHLKHQSAAGKFDGYGSPVNSRNEAELSGTKYYSQHTLTGKAFYYRDGLHLYGFKQSEFGDTIKKDDIRQRYFTAGGEANFSSNYKSDDKLNHAFALSYYHIAGLDGNKENNIRFSTTLDKQVDLFNIDTKQVVGLTGGYEFLNQQDSLGHFNTNLVLINPFIKAQINEYSLMAGFKMNISADSVTKAHLYPVAEARLELLPGALKVFAGIGGGMERTSLRGISGQNAYISSVMPWNYVFDKFRVYGGVQSNINRSLNFNAMVSNSTYENYPFFVTDTNAFLRNSFSLVFDDISVTKIKAELEFVKSARLRLSVGGSYNHYKLGNQRYAWYKPEYEFDFSARYSLQNKIVITLKTTVNGAVWALKPSPGIILHEGDKANFTMEPEKISGWVDASLGAEYRFNKSLSFWLNFNNLTNNTYFHWLNYRSYGLNVLGGVSYSF